MINRYLNLFSILGDFESGILFGPRGTGKSYLCHRFLKDLKGGYTVIDLLDREVYQQHSSSPGLFKSTVGSIQPTDGCCHTVFVDEVQKLPEILDDVHSLLEEDSRSGQRKVRFLMSGSSARKLKRGSANLLGGRAISLKLFPLHFMELELSLDKSLRFGTLPKYYLQAGSPELHLKSYADTYIREEVFQELLVRKVQGFERFLDVAAQYNGEPVNFTKLGKASGISGVTTQSYFEILTDILLVRRIDVWSYSPRKQMTTAPKYYFFDCGVLNALRGELSLIPKPSTYRYGKLFETFVINQILALNDYGQHDLKAYFWRTQTGQEVDLILARGPADIPRAIEIKSVANIELKDLKGLLAFKQEHPESRLYCLCQTTASYRVGEVDVLPWQEGISKIMSV